MIQLLIINETIKNMQLNERQLNILKFIRQKSSASNSEIREFIDKKQKEVSRITIVRDLDIMIKQGIIVKEGKGRSTRYKENIKNELLSYFDAEKYFRKGPDERNIKFKSFNLDIFKQISGIITTEEVKDLDKLNLDYVKRVKKLSATILKREFERLTIELSWKSSVIEGNTYSLIDTEILIKENKEAKGHKKEEAIMILNHKKALDFILEKKERFKRIGLRDIEQIHKIISKDLKISSGIRKSGVGITGTKYRPLGNQHQIKDVIEKTVKTINKTKDPFSKALIAVLMISYIQPFEDGNKRTARMLGNAVLLANNACPLSYRSVDDKDYKKAMLLFYEQNSARFFKELFIEQFQFAVDNYFLKH